MTTAILDNLVDEIVRLIVHHTSDPRINGWQTVASLSPPSELDLLSGLPAQTQTSRRKKFASATGRLDHRRRPHRQPEPRKSGDDKLSLKEAIDVCCDAAAAKRSLWVHF